MRTVATKTAAFGLGRLRPAIYSPSPAERIYVPFKLVGRAHQFRVSLLTEQIKQSAFGAMNSVNIAFNVAESAGKTCTIQIQRHISRKKTRNNE